MVKTDKKECTGCTACATLCPAKCITMKEDEEGFRYPIVQKDLCISCGLCQKVCPSKPFDSGEVLGCYGGYQKNDRIVRESSSGGLFSVVANEILKKGGVVFGVTMEGIRAVHRYVETAEDLRKLYGSKYLQSDLDDSMKQVKGFLDQGRWVLFCGTPCQVSGLHSFLGKTYEKLFTIDFVCHGISSPQIFCKYLEEIHGRRKWKKISFRDKYSGWKKFGIYLEAEDGYQYRESLTDDIYLQSFLKNMNLRPSCFQCKFRTIHRISDWTIGDLWGVEELVPDWKEDKGYSLILIHSEKGKQVWKQITENVQTQDVEIDRVCKYNSSLITSPWDFYTRDLFFKYAALNSVKKSMELAGKETWMKRLKRKGMVMWRRKS